MNNHEYDIQAYNNRGFLYQVFSWMSVALGISAAAAYIVGASPAFSAALIQKPLLLFILIFGQLALVMVLSFGIWRLSYPAALAIFLLYALLVGITFAWIFKAFTPASLYRTFVVTAGMFGFMAVYGYFSEADLSSLGSVLRMALVGLILGLVINIFFKSSTADFVLAIAGVIIFAGLTAFDIQKIKRLGATITQDSAIANKAAVIGALQLYLDVLNLFLSLLRLTGRRRE